MSVAVASRDNHVNFYNRHLLLLEEEYIDEQASRVCGGPLQGLILKQGAPDECRRSSGRSGQARARNVSLPRVGSRLTARLP
jgi:hypothetical protein